MMTLSFSIAFVGALGVLSRYHLDLFLIRFFSAEKITLLINIVGSLLAGFLFALTKDKDLFNQQLRLVLITGFCGGFTTFSAYSLQMVLFAQDKHFLKLSLFLLLAPVLSVLGAYLGYRLGLLK